MNKKAQVSLFDFIQRVMPEMGDIRYFVLSKPTVNKDATKKLMRLWDKSSSNNNDNKRFTKPSDMSNHDLELLEREQLVRSIGSDQIEITSKGIEVIKTSILGDERSAFEDDGEPVDYETALANTDVRKRMQKKAKTDKIASQISKHSNWYKNMKG